LFVAFTQADEAPTRRHEGAGVSLAVCKHFCDLLGGSLGASSEPGRGSTFVLELPSRPVALGPARPPAPILPVSSRPTAT
jgi:signal transduction histidine kinase